MIKKPRGLAAASPETRRRVAQKGGKSSPSNFKHNRERAKEAGRKGGLNKGGKHAI
jgi:general stress protein YciG